MFVSTTIKNEIKANPQKYYRQAPVIENKQEDIENMNRPITSAKFENVIKELPKNKHPGPDSFKAEFQQTFREELIIYNYIECKWIKHSN